MDCPRGPDTRRSNPANCQKCRQTNHIGHYLRAAIAREAQALGEALSYESEDGSTYNFVCPHFPWNYETMIEDPDTGQTMSIEGIPPLTRDDCPDHEQGSCKRFNISTSVRVSRKGGGSLGDECPVCELCLLGDPYQENLINLFS